MCKFWEKSKVIPGHMLESSSEGKEGILRLLMGHPVTGHGWRVSDTECGEEIESQVVQPLQLLLIPVMSHWGPDRSTYSFHKRLILSMLQSQLTAIYSSQK